MVGSTNSRGFELYAILGEIYGSGLPLGFLLVKNNNGAAGGTQRCLEAFIGHFTEAWNLVPITTHTDKNASEINSFRTTIPESKHQLCFWHALRAVRSRLKILRRQPRYYNVEDARREFLWISKDFLPTTQQDGSEVQHNFHFFEFIRVAEIFPR